MGVNLTSSPESNIVSCVGRLPEGKQHHTFYCMGKKKRPFCFCFSPSCCWKVHLNLSSLKPKGRFWGCLLELDRSLKSIPLYPFPFSLSFLFLLSAIKQRVHLCRRTTTIVSVRMMHVGTTWDNLNCPPSLLFLSFCLSFKVRHLAPLDHRTLGPNYCSSIHLTPPPLTPIDACDSWCCRHHHHALTPTKIEVGSPQGDRSMNERPLIRSGKD